MQKVYLFKVVQNGHERYLGRADARILAGMAKKAELNAVQEAQRPIDPKRLESLAAFVENDGTLSTSLVIGTSDNRLKVYDVEEPDLKGLLYYTEFPETSAELDDYQDVFDVMDGQHRLFSFLDDYCKIPDDIKYELSFEMYITPTMKDRRTIFKNTNEEQKSVDPNLLMWFRYQLNMLTAPEEEYYQVVSLLNSEPRSPLKERIIMSAEKITGGIKAKQLISLFDKTKLKTSLDTPALDDEKLFTIISYYLQGWELAVGSKFIDRENELGAFSKISGLRYMIGLLPTFFSVAQSNHEQFSADFVKGTIEKLYANELAVQPRDFFDKNSDYNKNAENPFVSETTTNNLVEIHKKDLKNLKTDQFDPMAQS